MDRVMIQGLFRPPLGSTLLHAAAGVGWERVRQIMRNHDSRPVALAWLQQAGFHVEVATDLGFAASAPMDVFSSGFGLGLAERSIDHRLRGNRVVHLPYWERADGGLDLEPPDPIADAVYALGLGVPAYLSHDATGTELPMEGTKTLAEMAQMLGATGGLRRPSSPRIRVVLVDSGLTTRVVEEGHEVTQAGVVTVDHDVRPGTAVVTDGSGTQLPVAGESGRQINLVANPGPINVKVKYCCVHPAIQLSPSRLHLKPAALGVDAEGDGIGHGVGVAANLLAIAPDVDLTVVKFEKASQACSALLMAYEENPDIINCSWSVHTSYSSWTTIETHLDSAAAAGITVVAAAGNAYPDGTSKIDSGAGEEWPITHASVVSVGGAAPGGVGRIEGSKQSSSFSSVQHPYRRVPDVVGVMGGDDYPRPFRFPTEPQSEYDWSLPDDDGWTLESGTSTCSAQVAGMAALVLQKWPSLSPVGVKNVLMLGARDVRSGASASGERAATMWDPATGWGLVSGDLTNVLSEDFAPVLREAPIPPALISWFGRPIRRVMGVARSSPDILVRRTSETKEWFDITTKHRSDLSERPIAGEVAYVFLRVDNRGAAPGSVVGTLSLHSWPRGKGKLIGSVEIQDIGAGEYVVSKPISWFVAPSQRFAWLRAQIRLPGAGSSNFLSEAWRYVSIGSRLL